MTENVSGVNSENTSLQEEFKVVVVGDGGCGKTSLIKVLTKKDFPEEHVPSVFEKYVTNMRYRGTEYRLNLYDTAGKEDYDRVRPLSYQNVNLVLICYDVICPSSYENILIKWYPEVQHFCPDVPIILVGCKSDLRKDKALARKLWSSGQNYITYIQEYIPINCILSSEQGEETKRTINAELYMECSAKNKENVDDIFREATKRALAATRKSSKESSKGGCNIL